MYVHATFSVADLQFHTYVCTYTYDTDTENVFNVGILCIKRRRKLVATCK